MNAPDDHPKLIFVGTHAGLCRAWRSHANSLANVEVHHGRFQDLETYDCLVSPANSFGLMDGGIDAAIVDFFGAELMGRVQARILDEYLGEQPVGTSIIVETGSLRHPYLAHTPTMRVPMTVARTDVPYVAMWGMLLAVRAHNRTSKPRIASIACPGLGTGTGGVPADEAARQMTLAYRHLIDPPCKLTWEVAEMRHMEVLGGCDLKVRE